MDEKLKLVIDKVRKLLSLSKSDNANEAANAAAMANNLLDKYRLTMADVEGESAEGFVDDPGVLYSSKRMTWWRESLAQILAKHYGCHMWVYWSRTSTRNRQANLKLAGRQSDVDIVKYMYAWLSAECERLSKKEAYGKGKVYVNSYCRGFVVGIAEQLKKSREDVKQTATSTAIVKIDSLAARSRDWIKDKYKLKQYTFTSQSQSDITGFRAGQKRGQTIHLGKSISSNNSKTLGK